jgi:sRNA-binding regulator protein Hfq
MSEYKVKKDRFSVKIFFLEGTLEQGKIFLSSHSPHHEGRESVRDVLNQTEKFIPISSIEGTTKLVNKNHILMISFPLDEQEVEPSDLTNTSRYEVVIHLVNHTRLEGRFIFLLPAHASRVKDFLNQTESFLELRRDHEIYLINKDYILFVEEK